MNIQAIDVYIDGCLLNSREYATPRTVGCLRCCAHRGITIYVATARPRRLVFRQGEVQGDVSFLTERGVFYNGASAYDDTLGVNMHWPMPGSLTSELVSVIESLGPELQIALQSEERHHSFRKPIADADLLRWGFERRELVPFTEAKTWDCSKIVAFGEGSFAGMAYHDIVGTFAGRVSAFRSDSGSWLQVMGADARKELGMTHLLCKR